LFNTHSRSNRPKVSGRRSCVAAWLVRRTKIARSVERLPSAYANRYSRLQRQRRCANQEFRLSPSRLHTGSAVARQLLAAEDLAAAIRKLASVALKARRQNELSLIRTRLIRSGKATQRFISRTVKPYRAPREHYAFIADCIHR
jgi:hypothetical protein